MTTIFVFGSNLAGRHGKGAALYARRYYNAQYGVGVGRTGMAYAVPTKDENLNRLPLDKIAGYVSDLLAYAKNHPELKFKITRLGCGEAKYTDSDIMPMFVGAPANCLMPPEWAALGNHTWRENEPRRRPSP